MEDIYKMNMKRLVLVRAAKTRKDELKTFWDKGGFLREVFIEVPGPTPESSHRSSTVLPFCGTL